MNRQDLRRLRAIRKKIWASQDYIAYGISEILRINIDQLPPSLKLQFVRIRKELIQKYNNIKLTTEDLIRYFARSPLLDEDPEKQIRLQQRQKYLREMKAISQDYHFPDIETNKARRKGNNKHKKRKE